MRRLTRLIGGLAAAVFAGGGMAAAEPARLALVIGNSAYAGLPALHACGDSLNVVAAALKRAGFAVTERLNVSNGRMGAAITDFADTLAQQPGSVAVVYFCGYAMAYDGRVFLLPASATLERDTDILTQGLVSRVLINSVLTADTAAGLVLVDSAATPGHLTAVAPGSVVNPAAPGNSGVVVTHSSMPLPDGATPLAAALSAGLAAPELDVRPLLADMQAALRGIPGLTVAAAAPAGPAWLRGGPPARPSVVIAAPAPTPAPVAVAQPPEAAAPVAAPVTAPPPPAEPGPVTDADRRRIQLALQRLGYYAGKVDAVYGPDTLAAIRRFQHELGAAMTGRLTPEQAARLLVDGR